jgi:hypothetical protein
MLDKSYLKVVVALMGAMCFLWAAESYLEASCVNEECEESSCWRYEGSESGAKVCLEYDYSTAYVDLATAGGGTRTMVTPEQAIQQRVRGTCDAECTEQDKGKATNCSGSTGEWKDAGSKHYCVQSTFAG